MNNSSKVLLLLMSLVYLVSACSAWDLEPDLNGLEPPKYSGQIEGEPHEFHSSTNGLKQFMAAYSPSEVGRPKTIAGIDKDLHEFGINKEAMKFEFGQSMKEVNKKIGDIQETMNRMNRDVQNLKTCMIVPNSALCMLRILNE